MKIISYILLLILIIYNINAFAGETEENIIKCSGKEGFELYKCEKSQVCKNSEFGKQAKKIVSIDKIYEENTNYETAKSFYRFNQNSIYKCGVLNSQEKAFKELNEKLLKTTDKTGILKTKVLPKIEAKIKKIKQLKGQSKCQTIDEKDKQKIIKKIVLDQSTLEYCNYRYFLKYLKYKENNDLEKNFPKGEKDISISKIQEITNSNKKVIDEEINHTAKLYNLAYETYTQYDSFIKIHILLELLKEDYRILRDKLYQTLHPINQVVYKIINAQSK